MKKLCEIIKNVEAQLSYADYGFKKSLATSADKDTNSFKIQSLDQSEEFGCLYYSLKGKELLEKEGIKTDVYYGKDEFDIWENHCFLKTEDGDIIDFSPHYKTIGAKHKEGIKMTNNEIEKYDKPHDQKLNKMIPLHHDSKSNSFLRIGLRYSNQYGFIKSRCLSKFIHLDMFKYNSNKEKYIQEGHIVLFYTGKKPDKSKKTLKNLIQDKVLTIENSSKNIDAVLNAESDIDNYVVKFLRRII